MRSPMRYQRLCAAAALALSLLAGGAPAGAQDVTGRATNWPQWGQNAQHHGFVRSVGQAMDGALAEITYDPFAPAEQAANDGELLVHYQAPLIEENDVFMAFETGTFDPHNVTTRTWHEKRLHWEGDPTRLVTRWDFASDWKPLPLAFTGWEAVFHGAVSEDVVYVPGAGGTIFKLARGSGQVITRINPFGTIDPNTFETGPITVDGEGNVYYNTLSLDPGTFALLDSRLVKVTSEGAPRSVTYASLLAPANPPSSGCEGNFPTSRVPWPTGVVPTDPTSRADPNAGPPTAACGAQRVGVNVAPAVARDGTIYTVSRAHLNSRHGYVVAVNPDLTLKWAASLRDRLNDGCGITIPIATQSDPIQKGKCRWGATVGVDPGTNRPPAGRVIDQSTSSPTVLPDGSVLYGAYTRYNVARGHLFRFSSTGQFLSYYDFGWDSTPAVLTNAQGTHIVIKDNHYDEESGFYCTPSPSVPVSQIVCAFTGVPAGPFYIAQLSAARTTLIAGVPAMVAEWQFKSTETRSCRRNADGSLSCTATNPNGFEWCVNGDVITGNGTVYANSEDGNLYAIPQGHTGVFGMSSPDVQRRFLRLAVGAAYTPTSVAPNGLIYTENDGVLFVVGAGGRPVGRPEDGHGGFRPKGVPGRTDREVTD